MRKNFNFKLVVFISAAVLSISLTGCGRKQQEKTILIQENQASKAEDTKFEVSKLTKIEGKGTIKGWLNENELLTSAATHPEDKDEAGRYKWLELKSVNYSSLDTKKILEDKLRDVVLSPDGTKSAYRKPDNDKGIIGFIDIKSGKDLSIGSYEVPGPLTWSDNSRYISTIVKEGIIVYDAQNNELNKYNIANLKTPSGAGNVLVSDDSKHAFIDLEAEQFIIDLSSNENVPKSKADMNGYKITNGTLSNFVFLSNSEVLFTAAKGELSMLYSYDINTKEKKEIMEGVSDFKLAFNKKYIAYVSGSTLSVGYLESSKISNSSVIFKGGIGSEFWWNKDNKKLVFQGKEAGDKALKQFAAELK